LGTGEKRGKTFRSSTDEIFETLTRNNKIGLKNDQCISEKTGAENIVKGIKQYQKKWLQHVQRMDRNRLPRQALRYRPEGSRNIGRPKKIWRDQLHFEDKEQGTHITLSEHDDDDEDAFLIQSTSVISSIGH